VGGDSAAVKRHWLLVLVLIEEHRAQARSYNLAG